jgi:predicted metal-binding membrane protein
MATGRAIGKLPGRDRAALIAGMALLTLIAGAYTVLGVGMEMSAIEWTARVGAPAVAPGKAGVMAFSPARWTAGYFALVVLMWWMLMTAMMTPAAGAAVLHHAALRRQAGAVSGRLAPDAAFLAGYLAVWGGFSAGAATLQWAMERLGMVSPTGLFVTHNVLAGAILTTAGLYQFSRFKHDCLAHCRWPARHLDRDFRPGLAGAFGMGAGQGLYCLGCCWFLTAMLFFGGIMNLYWIVGIALLVLVEHWLPRGESIGLGVGSVLILWGVLFLVSATGVL